MNGTPKGVFFNTKIPEAGSAEGENKMSVLGSLANAIGGGASELVGAVGSAGGLLPNSVASSATTLGHNITNPAVNINGSLNPITFGAGSSPLTSKPTQGSTNSPSVAVTPSSGSASTGGSSDAGLNAYLSTAGLQLGNLQNDYSAVDPAQNSAVAGVNNTYAPQYNTLDTQLAQGQAANQAAQTTLDQNKSIALRDLGNQLLGMYNSYNNQIGVSGAGNSSAADLIGYALSQEANNGRGDIGAQYGQQQTGINQNASNLLANYQNQKDTLDANKTSTLNQIAVQYGQERQNIQDQILAAGSDEARTALYMQDQAAANQALANMTSVVQQYGSAINSLNQQFSNVQAPTANLSQYDNGYQVQQFSPVQLAGMSYTANAAPAQTTATAPITTSLSKNDNQTPVGTLASLNQ